MSKTIEITRVEDVREGDVVTLAYKGHEFTGKVWRDGGGLYVGSAALDWYNEGFDDRTFVRATREVPDLPTEPGSVIIGSGVSDDGEPFTDVPLQTGGANHWFGWGHRGLYVTIASHALTAWTPAHIVPATETTTEVPNRCGGCWDLGPHNYGPGCEYRGLA